MNPRKLLIDLGRVLAAFALIILPYLLMNWSISGQIWPSTYYAKQAEYAELKEIPFLFRYLHQWRAPLAGLGILLLPGVIWITIRDIRAGKWVRLAPILWVCLYLAAYAFSLPVDYHHGRYSMPVIPVLLVLGLEGMGLLEARRQEGGWIWLASSVWRVSAVVIVFTFWLIGARTYASDVAIIETEMVQMAKWINSETSEAAVIATHDIGAMGYFGDRELIDLAGLVSPEIIPIIRDEAAIERFLEERKPEYLMTFPVWYPDLIASREVVHCTQGEYNPVVGGVHMCLFKW